MSVAISQPISNLSLSDLKDKFSLIRDRADLFFKQWLAEAEQLTNFEIHALTRLKRNYENIIETNPLEEVVKLVVVAPLLDLAGFYQSPFSIAEGGERRLRCATAEYRSLGAEVSTKLVVAEHNQTFTGNIDVLVVKQHLWVLVIESKQSRFDVTSGIPQALSYMLSQVSTAQAMTDEQFGMVTNGREVVFLKLNFRQPPVYAQSKIYQVIDTEDDLTHILQGLKIIGRLL